MVRKRRSPRAARQPDKDKPGPRLRLCPDTWPARAIGTQEAVLQTPKEGKFPRFKVAIADNEACETACSLAIAQELEGTMALLKKCDATDAEARAFAVMDGTKVEFRPFTVTALHKLLPELPPVPKVSTQVVTQVDTITTRFVLPEAFASKGAWDEMLNKPAAAVQASLGPGVARGVFGVRLMSRGEERWIQGFVRVAETSADSILKRSGNKATLWNKPRSTRQPAEVARWLESSEGKTPGEQLTSAGQTAGARPLVWRASGGRNVGVLTLPSDQN